MKRNPIYLRELFFGVLLVVGLITVAACASTPYPTSSAPATASPPSTTMASPPSTSKPAPPPPSTSAPPPASSTTGAYTVNVSFKTEVGNYLVDGKGITLYYFTKDSVGKSVATSAILQVWPIFNATTFVVPTSLNASDFGTITRDDGQKQTTYKGWPLYYYAPDPGPGSTAGQGINGVWFVVDPANFPPKQTSSPPPPPSTSPASSPSLSPSTSATPTPTPAPSRGGGY